MCNCKVAFPAPYYSIMPYGDPMRILLTFILSLSILGCAKGKVDILSTEGEFLGSCTASFDWHWYGAKDSVDYLLYICAKEHRDNGKLVSDNSIFNKDYSLPSAPEGQTWNKQNSRSAFKNGKFSEQKYGYILAAIEYDFISKKHIAREQLDSGSIDKKQYQKLIKQAEFAFYGE